MTLKNEEGGHVQSLMVLLCSIQPQLFSLPMLTKQAAFM